MASNLPEKSSPDDLDRYFVLGKPLPSSTVCQLHGETKTMYILSDGANRIHVSKRTMKAFRKGTPQAYTEVTHVGDEPASLAYARQAAVHAIQRLSCALQAITYQAIEPSLQNSDLSETVHKMCIELDAARREATFRRTRIELKLTDLGVLP